MIIAVIDGQGGGIGRAFCEKLKAALPGQKILALGTNSAATGQMIKGGADEGATGENAIVCNAPKVDIICGVIGILNANSMLGELTPKMAVAIGSSNAYKVLLPINRCHIHVVSIDEMSLGQHIDNAVAEILRYIKEQHPENCKM